MRGLIVSLAAAALAAGCATRVDPAAGGAPVAFQKPALDPTNGGALVAAEALRAGDILLSAADAPTSVGIRVFTLAPVSHAALYVGDARVAEAVGSGVRLRALDAVLAEESVVVAFRHPALGAEHAERIAAFAAESVGKPYDHVGVLLHAPFSLQRRVCEVPLVPEGVRDACIRGVATIQLGAAANDRFFCSQFVLEAYRRAGLPITDADPRWISPADLLHMREGDVPSVRVRTALVYVGHLKFAPAPPARATAALD